ncbi:MAG: adenylate/guanylate cyclase domain-containing protein, partial [Alphaproteobacteria bacterium]|nr:adenylate/guanylate cyclase domain-containing protein [Alphaproteobacteria bacterium]
MKRKIAAILASDVAGYSRLVSEDEEGTLARLEAYRAVFAEFVQKSGGRIFNTAGDAILAEFPSAVEATRCAIDIQESIRTRNSGYLPSKQMLFRIGITIGDVMERDNGDLLGDGVNIAARLEGLAEPGGICVSRNIYEQVANKVSVPFSDIGENEVKNMPQPVHAFRIELPGGERAAAPAPFAPSGAAARAQGRAKGRIQDRGSAGGGLGLAMALGGLVLAAGAGALGVWVWTGRAPAPAIQGELKPISPPVPLPPPVPPVAETLKPSAPEPAAPPKHASKPEPAAKPGPVIPEQSRPQQAKPEPAKSEPAKPEPAKPQLAERKPVAPPPAGAVPAEGELSPAERQATGAPAPAEPQVTPQPSPRIAGIEPQTPKPPAPPVAPQPSAPPAPKIAIPPGTPPAQIYALIAKSGGIVPDAATAPELYHNARTHESRGEIALARAAYLKLAALAEDLIDPQLRFAAFLRTQDGPQGAQEV